MHKHIIAFGMAAIVAAFAVSAHAADPIDVSNNTITCGTLEKVVVKASPALVSGGTSAVKIKLKGKLGGCSSDAAITIPDFKSSISGTLTLPTNDCFALVGGATSADLIVKWKANVAITPTTSTLTIGQTSVGGSIFSPANFGASYAQLDIGPPDADPFTVTGAFTGGDNGNMSQIHAISMEDITLILNACSFTGLKALDLGVGSLQLK